MEHHAKIISRKCIDRNNNVVTINLILIFGIYICILKWYMFNSLKNTIVS